jgi:shikimate kinase
MLAAGRVFWLEVSADDAVARAGKASGRPLLDGAADPKVEARKLLHDRRPFYERAHGRVDTTESTPREIVDQLLGESLLLGLLAGEGMLE